VVGSIALGDFQPQSSDVDVVAVTAAIPTAAELAALATVHRPGVPHVDVTYVTGEQLRHDPRDLSPPSSLEGRFEPAGGFMAHPVTWRELATHAIPVRGERLGPDDVWFDAGALRSWNLDNLDTYWRGQIDRWATADLSHPELADLLVRDAHGLPWLVLGVPRLHFTIATLDVTSKSGAGRHALAVADGRWHPVLETAIALRADRTAPLPSSPEHLRDEAVALCEWLLADAHRLAA
jgi:hypothetical protein